MHLLRILKNARKRNLFMILALLYLSIILVFAVVYWKIANISSEEFFVFQNDINMNIKVNAFKKNMKLNIYGRDFNNAVKELIVSKEYRRPVMKILDSKDKNYYIVSFNNVLGKKWADYYYLRLEDMGITHMKIRDVEKKGLNGELDVYKITLDLYKNNDEKYTLYKNSDKINIEKCCSIWVWIKDYPLLEEEFFNQGYELYPLNCYFENIMENSISFLDNSIIELNRVANGSFKYPLRDFLYFSVVTITTLGYGDILPNSTLVRTLVMFEVIFGVTIIGMFIPCLFWDRKD